MSCRNRRLRCGGSELSVVLAEILNFVGFGWSEMAQSVSQLESFSLAFNRVTPKSIMRDTKSKFVRDVHRLLEHFIDKSNEYI